MDRDDPQDLDSLEAQLAGRSVPPPGAEFRSRVLSAVRKRIVQKKIEPMTWWVRSGLVAAGFLLVVNLGMSLANAEPRLGSFSGSEVELEQDVAAMRALVPELSESEVRMMAWKMKIASRQPKLSFTRPL